MLHLLNFPYHPREQMPWLCIRRGLDYVFGCTFLRVSVCTRQEEEAAGKHTGQLARYVAYG